MKINAILSIIVQDDGDTFAKRAEMYYRKRPELIQMVEDLHKSYRWLAEKYDQLRSEVNNDSHSRLLSLSRSVNQVPEVQNYVEGEDLDGVQYSKPSAEDPDYEIEYDEDSSNGQADEFTRAADSSKSSKMKPDDKYQEKRNVEGFPLKRNTGDDSQLENEKLWNELRFKVSELVEDNLNHQAELIRRNDEKRGRIRDLCSKMKLVDETRAEKSKSSSLSHKVPKKNQSQLSRMKRQFLGRFTK